jgi:hypothetical protein
VSSLPEGTFNLRRRVSYALLERNWNRVSLAEDGLLWQGIWGSQVVFWLSAPRIGLFVDVV